jgi:hypothetical protein
VSPSIPCMRCSWHIYARPRHCTLRAAWRIFGLPEASSGFDRVDWGYAGGAGPRTHHFSRAKPSRGSCCWGFLGGPLVGSAWRLLLPLVKAGAARRRGLGEGRHQGRVGEVNTKARRYTHTHTHTHTDTHARVHAYDKCVDYKCFTFPH